MFREPRYKGNLDQIIVAERLLEMAPWLWAFNQIWAEGWSCSCGSMHFPDMSILGQKFDKNDDAICDIYVYHVRERIHQVSRVSKKEHHGSGERFFENVPNPSAEGNTVAERLLTTLNIPNDRLQELRANGKLIVPQFVICTPGPVDRTEHYLLYEAPRHWKDRNLLPLIMDAAPNFQPSWYNMREVTTE